MQLLNGLVSQSVDATGSQNVRPYPPETVSYHPEIPLLDPSECGGCEKLYSGIGRALSRHGSTEPATAVSAHEGNDR